MKINIKYLLAILSVFIFTGCSSIPKVNGIEVNNVMVEEKNSNGEYELLKDISDNDQIKKVIGFIQEFNFDTAVDEETKPQYQFHLNYSSEDSSVKIVTYTLEKSIDGKGVIVGTSDGKKVEKLNEEDSNSLYQLIVGEPLK